MCIAFLADERISDVRARSRKLNRRGGCAANVGGDAGAVAEFHRIAAASRYYEPQLDGSRVATARFLSRSIGRLMIC